jgi:hypothetical protein
LACCRPSQSQPSVGGAAGTGPAGPAGQTQGRHQGRKEGLTGARGCWRRVRRKLLNGLRLEKDREPHAQRLEMKPGHQPTGPSRLQESMSIKTLYAERAYACPRPPSTTAAAANACCRRPSSQPPSPPPSPCPFLPRPSDRLYYVSPASPSAFLAVCSRPVSCFSTQYALVISFKCGYFLIFQTGNLSLKPLLLQAAHLFAFAFPHHDAALEFCIM